MKSGRSAGQERRPAARRNCSAQEGKLQPSFPAGDRPARGARPACRRPVAMLARVKTIILNEGRRRRRPEPCRSGILQGTAVTSDKNDQTITVRRAALHPSGARRRPCGSPRSIRMTRRTSSRSGTSSASSNARRCPRPSAGRCWSRPLTEAAALGPTTGIVETAGLVPRRSGSKLT